MDQIKLEYRVSKELCLNVEYWYFDIYNEKGIWVAGFETRKTKEKEKMVKHIYKKLSGKTLNVKNMPEVWNYEKNK